MVIFSNCICLHFHLFYLDLFDANITSLVQPREEFLIRSLDQMFVERLKIEISDRCSTFVKPLIAIVKGVATRDAFDKRKIDDGQYVCELIGGNHRREAFCNWRRKANLCKHQLKFNCLQVNAYECYMVLQVISYRFSVLQTKKL